MLRVIVLGLCLCLGSASSQAILEPPLRTKDWRFIA